MTDNEKAELPNKLAAKQEEISDLKKQLEELNTQKEQWFQKKKEISQQITKILDSLKSSKSKRNNYTKQVRSAKENRDKFNNEVKEKIVEMKKLQKERTAVSKKQTLKIDPAKLKAEIEEMEFKIETGAIPFSAEQKLMTEIKDRRKLLDQNKGVTDIFDKIGKLNREIKLLKQKADEAHKQTQTRAEESQEQHETLISSSKQLDELRKQEAEALAKFVEWKNKYNELNSVLRGKLGEKRGIKEGLDEIEGKKRAKKDAEVKKELKRQELSVEEKIKTGQKLTTEDLLVFQAQGAMTVKKSKKK